MNEIPQSDPARENRELRTELIAAFERVLDSGRYILGPDVDAFEGAIAGITTAKHAIGVASGTDALFLSLRALGVGPGDAVVVPAFTFFATASAVAMTGAVPVVVDVDPTTWLLDHELARDAVKGASPVHDEVGVESERISAALPVHLYGLVDDARSLADELGIPVVEDAAQAIGASSASGPAGTLGSLAAFSFFPTKNLGALGDAGAVTTNDDDLADRVRLLRAHGARPRYHHQVLGTNSRLDALQAALLVEKLAALPRWAAARAAHATAYLSALEGVAGIVLPHVPPSGVHAWHQLTIRVLEGRRDALASHLQAAGVASTVYYPVPLHLQPALAHLGYRRGMLPVSEALSDEALSLPLFPHLEPAERDRVIDTVRTFFAGR